MQSLFILPAAVTGARVIWSDFDLKPWMNVKETEFQRSGEKNQMPPPLSFKAVVSITSI